jgi:putative phosphoesterase
MAELSRIALVSDTHGLLRPEVVSRLAGVTKILHLGDLGGTDVLEGLARIAPLHAVRGNVDHGGWAEALPETDVVDAFGHSVYLIHDLARIDIDPTVAGVRMVLYGHTHEPKAEERDGVWYVNPGSIGPRRFRQPVSYALLDEDLTVEFVTLD